VRRQPSTRVERFRILLCMNRTKRPLYFRQWRQFRGLSLERAGARIGMTHGNLSRIERGLQPYDQRILEAMADAYQCEVPDLLIRDPSDPEGIWSIWETVPPVERPRAIKILKALAEGGKR
jgi:transcriptional regulator with XRE-family HTH domain